MNVGITFLDPPLTSMSQLASYILSTSTVPSLQLTFQMLLLLLSSSSAHLSTLTRSDNQSCQMDVLCTLLYVNGRRILHGGILSGIWLSNGWEGKGQNFHRYGQNFWARSISTVGHFMFPPTSLKIGPFSLYNSLYKAVEFYVIFGRNFHWLFHFIWICFFI